MVTTFELTGERTQFLGTASTMAAASAVLPPGSYTTFRTYSTQLVLRLAQHLRRLEESAALLNQYGTLDDHAVRRALRAVLAETGYAESRFRLTFAPPRFFISVEPFIPYSPELYERGVICITLTTQRDNPHAKSTSFIASAGEAYKAMPPGVHEGLMVAGDGAVLEGLSSNFFALLDGTLHTEQARALVGVTQSLVLEVARDVAPEVRQSSRAVHLSELSRVSECYITSVSREIMPVIRIDDLVIGDGKPGPLAAKLIDGLHDLIEREAQLVLD